MDELQKGHLPVQYNDRIQRAEYTIKLNPASLRRLIERGLTDGRIKQWVGPFLVDIHLRDYASGEAMMGRAA